MFEVPYYNGIIKKVIIGFGTLFSEMKIERHDNDGNKVQTISVPIAFGPKEKQITRTDSDPNLENQVYTIVPRITFEILGYQYDAIRHKNKLAQIKCDSADGTRKAMYAPVPYNLEIQMYITTKNTEDALQIIEQILPVFSPEFTMSIKVVPEFNLIRDIPLILNSVTVQDDYDGDFESRRFVTHTLGFTAKLDIYNQASDVGVIKKVIVPLPEQDTTYTAEGGATPLEPIIEIWSENS